MATRVESATTVGQALPSLVKDVSQRRIDVYSGVRPRSIHSDEAWARQKGFRTCLAQGMMSTAYVSQLMVKLLGPGFARGGTLSMAFIKPVYAGDVLTAVSTVVDVYEKPGKRGGSMNFAVIETEYRNQGGTLVARARSVSIETGQVVKD